MIIKTADCQTVQWEYIHLDQLRYSYGDFFHQVRIITHISL
jgi:hypothetical protein